jgi:hypothetical protein
LDLFPPKSFLIQAFGLAPGKKGRPRTLPIRANKRTPEVINMISASALYCVYQDWTKEPVSPENFVEKADQLTHAEKTFIIIAHELLAWKWLNPLLGPLTAKGLLPWDTAIRLITGISRPKRAEAQFRSYFVQGACKVSFRTKTRLKSFITRREEDTRSFLNQRCISWSVVKHRYKNGFPIRDFFGWVFLIHTRRLNKIQLQWQTYLKKGSEKKS